MQIAYKETMALIGIAHRGRGIIPEEIKNGLL